MRSNDSEDGCTRWRRPHRLTILAAAAGLTLAGGGAFGATTWALAYTNDPTGLRLATAVSNLTVTAVASQSARGPLYPGGKSDVVLRVANPNPFPVRITAVDLPTDTTYADGHTTRALTALQPGCTATSPSGVVWSYSTATSGSSHTLTTPLIVGADGNANDPLTVTMTNAATMTAAAPAACEATYFSMPPVTGVSASGGAETPTTNPATDGWTN
jgi:hypothetical protein